MQKAERHNLKQTKLILILVAVILIAGSVFAHLRISGSEDYKGPLAVLDRLFDLTAGLTLAVILLSVGQISAKRFGIRFASTPEQFSISFFLGTGVIGLSVLLMGLIGVISPWPIVGIFTVAAALACREFPSLYRDIRAGVLTATSTKEMQLLTITFTSLAVVFGLRALTPPHTPDELIYHLPMVEWFAAKGGIYPSYDNSLGNMPFLIHMVYIPCLMVRSDLATRVFSLLVSMGTALALYAFCARYLTRRIATLALFAFFAAGMVAEVGVTARIDVSLAGMLFCTTYAMINYLETDDAKWLWTSAILAGFSLGIKHSAGLWLLFVGIMYLTQTFVRGRQTIGSILKRGIVYTLIAAAMASPWYIKNYVWFNNPIYPFFTGEIADSGPSGVRYFHGEDEKRLETHFQTAQKAIPEVVARQKEELIAAKHARPERHPMRLWEFFTSPNSYLMSEPFHFPNYLFLFSPFSLFLKPPKWIKWLLAISLAFALLVTFTSWIARFLLPLYPALTIVSAFTIVGLSQRVKQRDLSRRLPVWVVAIAVTFVAVISIEPIIQFNTLGFLRGALSRREFLLQFPFQPRIDFVNNELPANARVMMLGAQITYGTRREYIGDETWFSTKWRRLLVRNDSMEGVTQDLKQQGFTHILYCAGIFPFAAKMGVEGAGAMGLIRGAQQMSSEAQTLGPEYELLRNWSTFTAYRKQFLEPVYSDRFQCEVLKIR